MPCIHKVSSKTSSLSGFSRLEAILILLILATLGFLALPVYNTIQANRQDKAVGVDENPSMKKPPPKVDNNSKPQTKTKQAGAVPPVPATSPKNEEGSGAENASQKARAKSDEGTE
tara:strand:+ start:3082 stop:3429 length:348 start_codon:yes stop_codon:yes gene_type:complete